MKPALVVLALLLAPPCLALTACGRSPETEAPSAEARLEELEQEFNELVARDDATFEEPGEILDEAREIHDRPASPETIRAAHNDLAELRAVWEEVLVHVAAAEEIAAKEGYNLTLAQTQDDRDRQIESQEEASTAALPESGAAVVYRRKRIAAAINRARERIENAQNIIAIPDRRAAQREQALRHLAELERHNEQVLALHRAIRDAHTDPWEKRWADDNVRLTEEMWRQDLAEVREKLESDNTRLVTYAANWIAAALDGAPQQLERLRRQLDGLRAGGTGLAAAVSRIRSCALSLGGVRRRESPRNALPRLQL